MTAHTTSRPEFTADQLRSFTGACAPLPRPLVLLGDLNLRAPEPAEITGFTSLADVLTHPVDRPVRQIDHVLADGLPGGPTVRASGPPRPSTRGCPTTARSSWTSSWSPRPGASR